MITETSGLTKGVDDAILLIGSALNNSGMQKLDGTDDVVNTNGPAIVTLGLAWGSEAKTLPLNAHTIPVHTNKVNIFFIIDILTI